MTFRVNQVYYLLLLIFACCHSPRCASARGAGGADTSTSSVYHRSVAGVMEERKFIGKMIGRSKEDGSNYEDIESGRKNPTEIEVCVVGLGRTGSTSIYTALQTLGYTPMHDQERMEITDLLADKFDTKNPISAEEFAIELGQRGFDAILYYGYDFVDWCVKNNKKIVLTVRDDPNKWAESWLRVVSIVDYLEQPPFSFSKVVQQILPSMRYVCKDVPTAGRPDEYKNLDVLVEGYQIHNDKIRNMVPSEQLLEFNAKQGWEPFCDFLGKDVPKGEDFPHVNDKIVMKAVLTTFWTLTWIWPVVPLLLVMVVRKIVKTLVLGRLFNGNDDDSRKKDKGIKKTKMS